MEMNLSETEIIDWQVKILLPKNRLSGLSGTGSPLFTYANYRVTFLWYNNMSVPWRCTSAKCKIDDWLIEGFISYTGSLKLDVNAFFLFSSIAWYIEMFYVMKENYVSQGHPTTKLSLSHVIEVNCDSFQLSASISRDILFLRRRTALN